MNDQEQDRSPHNFQRDRQLLEFWFSRIVQGVASVGHVFTRRHFGERYFDSTAPMALVVYGFYVAASYPAIAREPWLLLGGAYLCLVAVHRVSARHASGRSAIHSCFNGLPIVSERYGIDVIAAKRFADPMIVFLIGVGLAALEWPHLAMFIWMAALAGALEMSQYRHELRHRARQIHDAWYEHDDLMDECDRR